MFWLLPHRSGVRISPGRWRRQRSRPPTWAMSSWKACFQCCNPACHTLLTMVLWLVWVRMLLQQTIHSKCSRSRRGRDALTSGYVRMKVPLSESRGCFLVWRRMKKREGKKRETTVTLRKCAFSLRKHMSTWTINSWFLKGTIFSFNSVSFVKTTHYCKYCL